MANSGPRRQRITISQRFDDEPDKSRQRGGGSNGSLARIVATIFGVLCVYNITQGNKSATVITLVIAAVAGLMARE